MDLIGTVCEGENWIHLAQSGYKWRGFVNAFGSIKCGECFEYLSDYQFLKKEYNFCY